MSRRWLVTGSRDGRWDVAPELDHMARLEGLPTELVVGEARGVDRQAKRWAEANRVPVRVFAADWQRHGRKAGPLRNQEMVDYCRQLALCLAFPGPKSRGTHDCYERALGGGLQGHMVPVPEIPTCNVCYLGANAAPGACSAGDIQHGRCPMCDDWRSATGCPCLTRGS